MITLYRDVETAEFGNALEKLLALWLCQRGMETQSVLSMKQIVAYCCEPASSVTEALRQLERRGYFKIRLFPKNVEITYADHEKPRGTFKPTSKNEIRRAHLVQRDGCNCWYCGVRLARDEEYVNINGSFCPPADLEHPVVEHQTPRKRGGADDLSNLVLSCWSCNSSKNNRTLAEYRDSLGVRRFHGERKFSQAELDL